MKAVISVIGKDTVGILAKVSTKCAEFNVNVDDVTQTVMQDIFTMIMMTDTTNCSVYIIIILNNSICIIILFTI